MPELLLELFSEEIPARMQTRAAADLARLLTEAVASLRPADIQIFSGPRRIALAGRVEAEQPASSVSERGPRLSAPEAALAGFLRKHGAAREQLVAEGDHWVLSKSTAAVPAATLLGQALPALLRRFPWPKSMRWGAGSAFTWVRPLRRILCLLDGSVVPLSLAEGADSGHGLRSGDETEGHRFHAPGPFAVSSFAEWEAGLRSRRVIAGAPERRRLIEEGIAGLAASEQLSVVPDEGLLDEVAGLVEWPVPLLGRIDAAFMDLPPEVMQVSMRVNQRYFALRHADGSAAARFGFAANIEAEDGGAVIIAGNERVLRARFSDARHFWDLDRRTRLESRLPALDAIVFHAKLGTQGDRTRRLELLAHEIALWIKPIDHVAQQARRAARLAKADLTTGMVGEFPELQGVMGGYYARLDGEVLVIADAIRDHYSPRGVSDDVPSAQVTMAVALADKLDQLASFFAIGEVPSGSSDPFALRRAALGIIRIIRGNGLRIPLRTVLNSWNSGGLPQVPTDQVLNFIVERLRVLLRGEGLRHDVLDATFAVDADEDLVRLLALTTAVSSFLDTADGANLLAASRRAANILKIEERRDGRRHSTDVDPRLFTEPGEIALHERINLTESALRHHLHNAGPSIEPGRYIAAMGELAQLRPALDEFFDKVTVNVTEPELRENRLRLLARVGAAMAQAADFSRIEG